MRAQGAHGVQLSNSCDGRRSTFIVHDNTTVTLNEPGGTHQTAPMTERHGRAEQPSHRSHHVYGLPGPHRPKGSQRGPGPKGPRSPKAKFGTQIWGPNLGSHLEPKFGSKFGAQLWHPNLQPNLGSKSGAQIWAPNLGPKSEAQIWTPNMGPKVGAPNFGP